MTKVILISQVNSMRLSTELLFTTLTLVSSSMLTCDSVKSIYQAAECCENPSGVVSPDCTSLDVVSFTSQVDTTVNAYINAFGGNGESATVSAGLRGVKVIVGNADGIVYSNSFGNYIYYTNETKTSKVTRPVAGNEVLAIASMGKPINALLILSLMNEGVLTSQMLLVDSLPAANIKNKFVIETWDQPTMEPPSDYKPTLAEMATVAADKYNVPTSTFGDITASTFKETIMFEDETLYSRFEPVRRNITLTDAISERAGFYYIAFDVEVRNLAAFHKLSTTSQYTAYSQVGANANSARRTSNSNTDYVSNYLNYPVWACQPGEFCYGSEGTAMSQVMAVDQYNKKHQTQFTYQQLYEKYITTPLKMTGTGFLSDTDFGDSFNKNLDVPLVDYFLKSNTYTPVASFESPYVQYSFPNAGAFMHASSDDLSKFFLMLVQDGQVDGIQVIPKKVARAFRSISLAALYPEDMTNDIKMQDQGFKQSDIAGNGFSWGRSFRPKRVAPSSQSQTLYLSDDMFSWGGIWGTRWAILDNQGAFVVIYPSAYGTTFEDQPAPDDLLNGLLSNYLEALN